MAEGGGGLHPRLARLPDAGDRAAGLRYRHRAQGARRSGEGVRGCRSLLRPGADAEASPPRGIPFEELHRGRGDEAPRSGRTSPGRPGGPLRRRIASERGGDDPRSAAVAQRWHDSRRCGGWAVSGSPAVCEREGIARGPCRAADARTQHPIQVLEPRLRARRTRRGGGDRGALPRVDRARDRCSERAARDHSPTHRRHEAHRRRAGTRASCRSGAGLSYPATTRPMPSRPPAASFRPQPTSHASSRASIRRRNEACSRPQAVAR